MPGLPSVHVVAGGSYVTRLGGARASGSLRFDSPSTWRLRHRYERSFFPDSKAALFTRYLEPSVWYSRIAAGVYSSMQLGEAMRTFYQEVQSITHEIRFFCYVPFFVCRTKLFKR